MKFYFVNSFFKSLVLMTIRNKVASFMTGNPNKINLWQQFRWYFKIYRPAYDNEDMIAFLVMEPDNELKAMGYGLIVLKEGKYWITAGILESFRGLGYGKLAFQGLIKLVFFEFRSDVWLEVRTDNTRAKKLYDSLGFEEISRTVEKITMVKKYEQITS